jgi:large subunit ribosomal protein L15
MKGQNARAGGGTPLWHQGGNLPFFRRLPFKRGFTPPHRIEYSEVNLDQLAAFSSKVEVTPEALVEARLLKDTRNPVVILGRGEVKKALTVKAHRVTSGARAKIEAAGGSVEIIE